jgi:hypothetical protein
MLEVQHFVASFRNVLSGERETLVGCLPGVILNVQASVELISPTPQTADGLLASVKDVFEVGLFSKPAQKPAQVASVDCWTITQTFLPEPVSSWLAWRLNLVVRERGLEPPPLTGPDPKSGASAISPLARRSGSNLHTRCDFAT